LTRAITEDGWIGEAHTYNHFIKDLSYVVTDYFGGIPGTVSFDPSDGLGWTIAIEHDESVPEGGGIYAKYDDDEQWEDS